MQSELKLINTVLTNQEVKHMYMQPDLEISFILFLQITNKYILHLITVRAPL